MNININIKNIIFDFDGTIVDTREGIVDTLKKTVKKFSGDEPDNYEQYIGDPITEFFKKTLKNSNKKTIDEAVKFYEDEYRKTGIHKTKIYENVIETLSDIKSTNFYNLFLASAKPSDFLTILMDKFFLHKFFVAYEGSPSIKNQLKKDTLLKTLIRSQQILSSNSFMVGDRKSDILPAKKLKFKTILVKTGYATDKEIDESNPDYIIENLSAIKNILKY